MKIRSALCLLLAATVAAGCTGSDTADGGTDAGGVAAADRAASDDMDVAAAAATAAPSAPAVLREAPAFTLTDADGEEHSLSDFRGKYVVLEWVNFQCPYVRKHYGSGNMQALQRELAGGDDVVWLSVCSSAAGKQGYYEGEQLAEQLASEEHAATAYLIDADGSVGRAYGAKTTPHMFVIDPRGGIVYEGAIDSVRSTSPDDIASATNYVRAALEAARAGEPIEAAVTTPYGCSVKYVN